MKSLIPLLAAGTLAVHAGPSFGRPTHPLDPLEAEEITKAAKLLQAAQEFPVGGFFASLTLQEPPKQEVLAFKGGDFRREASAVILDAARNRTLEARVDLRASKILSFQQAPGVQPSQIDDEFFSGPNILRKDPRFQAALRRRGILDAKEVHIDLWAPGHIREPEFKGRRIFRAVPYFRGKSTFYYARPIEGLSALVDMNSRKVVSFSDRGVVPIAVDDGGFDEKSVGRLRPAPKPLAVVQERGPGFALEGNSVRWENWRLRFAVHPREGLVLYQVGYEDRGKVRPVLYRASLSEMVVPYGDPDPDWEWRSAFDAGEYGIGAMASPLDAGKDVPENAVFIDATLATEVGEPRVAPRAVALYERDGGVLWKHYNSQQSVNEARRGRELVITFLTSVGNYDYGMNWVFRQDGSLEFYGELTGIMLAKGVRAKTVAEMGPHDAHFGHLVAPRVAAPHHQHFFNFRLDLDVDGPANSAAELETRSIGDSKRNPYGNAFEMIEHPLAKEREAGRDLSLSVQRKWKIFNPAKSNSLGYPAAYLLVPGENSVPYARPEAPARRRAGFLEHHFWATLLKETERYAGGEYAVLSTGDDGLLRFSADDESITAKDLVVWYTLGVTHIPRPEEWPVMPVHRVGFKLLPAGFFDRNPALDLPARD